MTLEMPGPEWYERALAIHTGLAPQAIEAQARDKVLQNHEFLARMRNTRVVERSVALGDLTSLIQECRATLDVPLRLVLIDYLGLLRVRGDAYERASAIGLELKLLAKSEKIAIMVAMQLSRAGGDGSSEVGLEMIRDSGVLEESVDFLLGAWQPGRAPELSQVERDEYENILTVKILKSRKGGDGHQVNLHFHPDSRRLYELAEEDV
jgi:replicative DNA helicase